MTDYFVFRHGDTSDSKNSTFHILVNFLKKKRDTHNLKILPMGLPALKNIGEYLKEIPTDANFSSPYSRCVESAKIVGEVADKKYVTDDRLSELENKGESFSHFSNRVKSFLDEIEERNYSAVSICTHGAVMAAFKHFLTQGNFYFYQVIDYPTPGHLLIIKNGKARLMNFNNKGVDNIHSA